jgi:hypothetical protein
LGNNCEYTTNTAQPYQEARAAAAFVTLKPQLNTATASEEIGVTAVGVWRIVLAHGLCEVDEKTGTPQRK